MRKAVFLVITLVALVLCGAVFASWLADASGYTKHPSNRFALCPISYV